jgi:sortase B
MRKIRKSSATHTSKRLQVRRLLLRAVDWIRQKIRLFHAWALLGMGISAVIIVFIIIGVIKDQRNVQPARPSDSTSVASTMMTIPIQTITGTIATTAETAPPILSKYTDLYDENPDLVGWLTVQNTAIDYPVVQGADNDYYLHQDYYGEESKYGCIFLDFNNKIFPLEAPCNLVLYGHNMKDNSMFGELEKYKKESFFEENPTFTFSTLYGEYTWEVFSVFVSDVYFYYNDTTFPSEANWTSFLNSCVEKSMYETGVVPGPDDIILTLSTCSYEFSNARFAVQARLVRDEM